MENTKRSSLLLLGPLMMEAWYSFIHTLLFVEKDQAAFLQRFTFGCYTVYPVVQLCQRY